jgi:8-oxo-dGTP diphosphatase
MSAEEYPKPFVTVDAVVFSIFDDDLKVLLIKRGRPPFEGRWALPGGFVEIDETLETAAKRELQEETGVANVQLEQLYTFGDPGRDPRGRSISVVYYTLANADRIQPQAATDAADARWFSAFRPPPLAFDHRKILRCAVERLRNKTEWTTVGAELLPRRFTLDDLQRVYEIILQRPMDKRYFKKKVLSQGNIVEIGQTRDEQTHRPIRLYTFCRRRSRRTTGCF